MIEYVMYIFSNIRIFIYFIGRIEIEFFINPSWVSKEFKNFKYFLFEQEDKNYYVYWEFLNKVSYNDKGTCFVGITFILLILSFLLIFQELVISIYF